MSQFIKHIACEKCGSSDANALFDDGHTYCYACLTYVAGDKVNDNNNLQSTHISNEMRLKGDVKSIPDRGITAQTCQYYGVTSDETTQSYPYADAQGAIIAAKIRTVADKNFTIAGDWKGSVLFGQNLFAKGGKTVTIHEGELDALAGFQMAGSKYANVSVRNGAQAALKDVKAAYEWLTTFDEIYICFDADEPGQKAASEVAEVLGNKCKIVKHLTGYKDACDYLKANKGAEYVKQWWAAEQWTPDGIIAGSTLWDEVNRPVEKSSAMYPWPGVNELTYGIRAAELITVTAGSGLGKSQFLREILWHLIKTTNHNIGLMFMEESVRKTARGIMSLHLNKPLHLPDTQVSPEELKNAFDITLGTDRLFFWDNFGSTDINNVINRIRYFAKAADCKYVFLDHISMVVSAQSNGDERKSIDELMTKLRMLVQETGISLIAVSHLKRPESKGHEEGAATSLSQLRGSGAIAQLSDIVIGLVRNAQAEDPMERNTTRVSILKNRFSGLTSPHCASLLYNKDTGRMLEMQENL
jgi:twinkle protein